MTRGRRRERPDRDSPDGGLRDLGPDPAVSVDPDTDVPAFITDSPTVVVREASTSSQSFEPLASVEVPTDAIGRLDEVSAAVQANGAVKVRGEPFDADEITGQTDVTFPSRGGYLSEQATIRVDHRSTDGNSTTTKAIISVRVVEE